MLPNALDSSPSLSQPPTRGELLRSFFRVSLTGFGGVLPWARRMIVEERKWMSPEEFNEAFALCQFLPGPNIINFSIVFGSRFHGGAGAAAALAGLLGPPLVIVLALGALYAEFGDYDALRRTLTGVAAAAAGLLVAVAAKMIEPLARGRTPLSAPVMVASAIFVAIGLLRWPLPWVLAVAVPISVARAWWVRR